MKLLVTYLLSCFYVDQFSKKYIFLQEEERSGLLDHFRSLSVEASALENNNHSLETEIQDAKAQLRAANDRITDLEQLLESKDTLVNNYEHQVCFVFFH
jgi:predicted  nucleic acid-binding Zn-ribbon protein